MPKSACRSYNGIMIKDTYARAHFIGIGGVSLSSLAVYLVKQGVKVTGSDRCFSDKLTFLNEHGCKVWVGSDVTAIKNPDVVIYSSAIPESDEELIFCRKNGFFCLERNAFLNILCDDFDYCVAVGGTHGKTTVTAMLIKIFAEAKKSFFGHVGGETEEYGNCYYSGNEYLITEACEYRKSMLCLKPEISVVLNAEFDHPDTYGSLEDVYSAFKDFLLSAIDNKGLALTNGDCRFYDYVKSVPSIVTFGLNERNRFRATDIYEYKKGYLGFLIKDYGNLIGNIKLKIPGEHNVTDALAAFATAYLVGIPCGVINSALNSFTGVKRRFEFVCKYFGCDVYTDYAHHPREIAAAIRTAKTISDGKTVVVFQPHTYSRTEKLFDEFTRCFSEADKVVIFKEYAARETPDKGKSALRLYDALPAENKYYCDNIISAAKLISELAAPPDTVLILGAGDIINLCEVIKSE